MLPQIFRQSIGIARRILTEWQTMELLKKKGMTILLTTHHLDEAEFLCSRSAS